ncbi:hypothetical protein [Candidatus Reidiella endopervernicosa]|uniref:AsmA family protein n=1 Tax=Candidatus Reidiella endopervernicosa TaxID=2738883 RepID=A0A6N0HVV3_9GAMM|nr:hypothetical protein [Candidatus Reidiella endopervernicosa]QKQ26407.1 hypothetical protein HUE57_09025 [Candidatus Reidiella endopervernicosa]
MNDTAVAPESKSPPIWQRRWLQITAAIVLLVALMLAALPFALGHSLESWLKDQGASTATVENIDLNLFTGQLRIDQLNYQFSDGAPQHLEQLTTTLNVRDLWQRLIHIESLTINNSSIALSVDSEGRLTVASLALPATKSDASTQQQNPWGFTLDQLILDSASISYSRSQLTASSPSSS